MSDRESKFRVRPEHVELFSRFFNGPLQAGDLSQLEELLRTDPAARELFVKVAEIDGMLVERSLDDQRGLPIGDQIISSSEALDPFSLSMHDATVVAAIHEEDIEEQTEPAINLAPEIPVRPAGIDYRLVFLKISAAAIVLFCVGLAGYLLHRPKNAVVVQAQPPVQIPQEVPRPTVLAAVIDGHFKLIGNQRAVPVVGASLPADPLFLESGWAKLDFPNGVSAIVEGPALFTVKSATLMHLDQGRVSARVSKQGRGFTVESTACRVVDLGTDFGMSVTLKGVNEVQVFEGQVALSTNTADDSHKTDPTASILSSGQARRVDHVGAPAVEIAAEPSVFVRVNEFVRWAGIPASAEADRFAAYYERFARMPGLTLLYVPDASNGSLLKNRAMATAGNFDIPIGGDRAPTFVEGRVSATAALNLDSTKKQGLVLSTYPITQTGNITGLVWVKLNNYIPYGSIIKSWGETKSGAFHFGLMGEGRHLEIQLDGTLLGGPNLHDDKDVPLNRWVPVAFVSDGTTVRLYQDGAEVASGPSRPIPFDQVVRSFSIGFKTGDDGINPSPSLAAGFWDGQIGEIAIFDRALSADEIFQISQLGLPLTETFVSAVF